MLSLIFASKARLAQELAVERATRTLREEQLAEARQRLAKTEREFGRLRDQVLIKAGHVTIPLADPVPPPANPYAGILHGMSLTGTTRESRQPHPSEAPMSDA